MNIGTILGREKEKVLYQAVQRKTGTPAVGRAAKLAKLDSLPDSALWAVLQKVYADKAPCSTCNELRVKAAADGLVITTNVVLSSDIGEDVRTYHDEFHALKFI